MESESPELLHAKLNLETAQIEWKELQRFFATGAVFFVDASLDMVDVALKISEDNRAAVEAWLNDGQLAQRLDARAVLTLDALPVDVPALLLFCHLQVFLSSSSAWAMALSNSVPLLIVRAGRSSARRPRTPARPAGSGTSREVSQRRAPRRRRRRRATGTP